MGRQVLIANYFAQAIKWLYDNREDLKWRNDTFRPLRGKSPGEFLFQPSKEEGIKNYAGMPSAIYELLEQDEIELIQKVWDKLLEDSSITFRMFKNILRQGHNSSIIDALYMSNDEKVLLCSELNNHMINSMKVKNAEKMERCLDVPENAKRVPN